MVLKEVTGVFSTVMIQLYSIKLVTFPSILKNIDDPNNHQTPTRKYAII